MHANDTKLGLAVKVNIVKDTGNMQSFKKNLQIRCLTEATQGTNPLFVTLVTLKNKIETKNSKGNSGLEKGATDFAGISSVIPGSTEVVLVESRVWLKLS